MTQLTPEIVLQAYMRGIFPMAEGRHDPHLYWIDPEIRGVIPLDTFHLPRRLARTLRTWPDSVYINRDFKRVIEACAQPGRDRQNTWINDEIVSLYTELHAMGFAHSVECWSDDRLIGGLYGISIRGAFFGESMFSLARDASKVALVHLVGRLRSGGYKLLDVQFVTSHLKGFGAVEIPRSDYQNELADALSVDGDFYSLPDSPDASAILQSITQTS
jgi:leucyl/phenylalanyl-tRNA--protein transferase